MKKRYVAAVFVLLLTLSAVLAAVYLSVGNSLDGQGASPTPTPPATPTSQPSGQPTPQKTPTPTPTSSTAPVTYSYTVVNMYPHSTNAFTEGLLYDNGVLYESTGNYGASSLRRISIQDGAVLQQVSLSPQFYGEGLAVVNDSLIQLTWREGVGFIYDKDTFALKGNFTYSGEGWGLTYDGSRLIMSNGSSTLTFLDPNTFQKTGTITVHDGDTPIVNLNELEYVNGDVYANIWFQQKIAIINPQTGQVKAYMDLSGIHTQSGDDVLNGIAYDALGNRLFVTGKDWPSLYQITITPKT